MATPINQIKHNELHPLLDILARAGTTTADAKWLRSGDNAKALQTFLDQQQLGPYLQASTNRLVEELYHMNERLGWNIPSADLQRLDGTRPSVQNTVDALVSLRIRFGTGEAGAQQTYDRHLNAIGVTYGDEYRGSPGLVTLASGCERRAPTVEWTIVHTDHPAPESKPAYVAEELLALAWLYPDYIRRRCRGNFGLLAPGYAVFGSDPSGQRHDWDGMLQIAYRGNELIISRVDKQDAPGNPMAYTLA